MKINKSTIVGLIAAGLVARSTISAADRTYINGSSVDGDGLPFSGAVMVGDTLYLSGALGLVDGKVPEDPADEARAVLDAIQGTLQEAGMTMDDLAYVQIFCSDVSHYGAFNEVYVEYFPGPKPARSALGANGLALGARVEIECWATVG